MQNAKVLSTDELYTQVLHVVRREEGDYESEDLFHANYFIEYNEEFITEWKSGGIAKVGLQLDELTREYVPVWRITGFLTWEMAGKIARKKASFTLATRDYPLTEEQWQSLESSIIP